VVCVGFYKMLLRQRQRENAARKCESLEIDHIIVSTFGFS